MSSSPCSRLAIVLVALLCSAGIAAGVSVSEHDTPDGAEVGERIETEYVLTDLYTDYDQWTLRASTELENVTWTFRLLDQSGDPVDTTDADGQNGSVGVSIDDGVATVQVRVVGEVPAVGNYTYEPAPTFVVAELEQTREGGTSESIGAFESRHYTEESLEAREAIESAESAIEAAGGDAQAEESLGSAIDAYEGENFGNAVNLAERAEREAGEAAQTRQRNRLILYGAIALVVIAVVVGAVYWYLNRDTGSRL